jgi:hypothetical protein
MEKFFTRWINVVFIKVETYYGGSGERGDATPVGSEMHVPQAASNITVTCTH